MHRAATAYFQTKVTTTNQGDIVVLLYDGAIKFLTQAVEHLAANDMAQKGLAISRALDVINELDSALNMEKGSSLSENLHSLYLFCSNHLVMANLKKDPERIGHVIKILAGLRSAYAEILALPEAQEAAQQAAASMRVNAILPARSQAGTIGTGADTPAPGVNARLRKFHATQAAEQDAAADVARRQQESAQNTESATPEEERPEQAAPTTQDPADTACPSRTSAIKKDATDIAQDFAPLSGFSAKSGATAYQKSSER